MAASAHLFDFQIRLPEAAPEKPRLVPPPPPAKPGERDDVRQLRAALKAQVAAKVTSATELIRALKRRRRDDVLATTLAPLDALLGGGLPRGKVVELAGRRSSGRYSIAMATLAAATSAGEAAVLIDLGDHFDPQLAAANGVDLRRMLWIRPKNLKHAVMAAEMIAATGFQCAVVDTGLHPIRGRRVPDATWVRLARSAEAHGTAMLISTPYPITGTTSEALVSANGRANWSGGGATPRILVSIDVRITLEKHRHQRPGGSETLTFRAIESCLD